MAGSEERGKIALSIFSKSPASPLFPTSTSSQGQGDRSQGSLPALGSRRNSQTKTCQVREWGWVFKSCKCRLASQPLPRCSQVTQKPQLPPLQNGNNSIISLELGCCKGVRVDVPGTGAVSLPEGSAQ